MIRHNKPLDRFSATWIPTGPGFFGCPPFRGQMQNQKMQPAPSNFNQFPSPKFHDSRYQPNPHNTGRTKRSLSKTSPAHKEKKRIKQANNKTKWNLHSFVQMEPHSENGPLLAKGRMQSPDKLN